MKEYIDKKTKMTYCSPKIEHIKLDNEISLELQSSENPMGEPQWSEASKLPGYNPFKSNIT